MKFDRTILIDRETIKGHHINHLHQLQVKSMFNIFQEVGFNHSEHYGFGYSSLKTKGLFWVLSRQHLIIEKLPQWGDEVVIKTWCDGPEGLFVPRNWVMEDLKGSPLIKTRGLYLIVNHSTKRPVRPTYEDFAHCIYPHKVFEETPKKIISPKGIEPSLLASYPIRKSEIDMHQHINHSHYLTWLYDSLDDDTIKNIRSITINFIKEGYFPGSIFVNVFPQTQMYEISSPEGTLALIEISS